MNPPNRVWRIFMNDNLNLIASLLNANETHNLELRRFLNSLDNDNLMYEMNKLFETYKVSRFL